MKQRIVRDDLAASLMGLGWSKAELARRCHVDASTVHRWAREGVPGPAQAYLDLAILVKQLGLAVEKERRR